MKSLASFVRRQRNRGELSQLHAQKNDGLHFYHRMGSSAYYTLTMLEVNRKKIVTGLSALMILLVGYFIGRRPSWDCDTLEMKQGIVIGRTPGNFSSAKPRTRTFVIKEGANSSEIHETLKRACINVRCGNVQKLGRGPNCTRGDPSLAIRLQSIQYQPPDICSGKYPPFDMRKFVVLSTQRSGTTWLAGKLGSHPQISMVHEILLQRGENFAFLDQWMWQQTYFETNCLLSSIPNCQETQNMYGNNNVTAAGFGVQGSQGWFDPEELKRTIPIWKRNGLRVIVLERRNEIAHKIASNGQARPKGANNSELVHLEDDFLRSLKTEVAKKHSVFEKMKKHVVEAGIPIHYITYESLVRDPAAGFIGVYEFLLNNSQLDNRWVVREDDEGNENIFDSANYWTTTVGSNKRRHHTKKLKDRIDNYNESLALLSQIYPEGVCMLDEDCDWFY